ncbi:hypothetical protein R3P38DRAFT_3337315 [Favolaschia claudopus]|uniref:Transposase n=1 Tax=Favolaschia claudopus TaxID=2862362 RepID=A0AAV9Z200_9AGAR
MPNPGGSNASQDPSDETLRAAFADYAKENSGSGLEASHQIARLKQDFNLNIGRTTLFKLRKRVQAPSVRKTAKTMHPADLSQHIVDIKENDPLGPWGVDQVRGRLAIEGILATRRATRTALHDHFDDQRFVGNKKSKKHRTHLFALGPWHQEHSDGHEKLGEQALLLGKGIHLPIYGSKDQYAAWLHALVLMPNVRNALAIAHYYLDLVEGRGYRISIQLSVDGGTECTEMLKIHETLRADAAPEFVPPSWPTDNTPIESFWRWKRNGEGRSIRNTLEEGVDPVFSYPMTTFITFYQTFYWIWAPFIQRRLDIYRDYWNHHRLQLSKDKRNGSGLSPKNLFLNPQAGLRPELVHQLREAYGGQEAREKAYRFVSPLFQEAEDRAYVDLGLPNFEMTTIWIVFSNVVRYLEEHFDIAEISDSLYSP